jgi:hypothetical protein
LRPRGVQKRDFAKRGHVELLAKGGLYAGDLTSSSWIAGGALGFWFTEDLGLELGFEVTPIALDLDSPLAEFFGDDRFESGLGYLPMANLVWSPVHTKMKTGRRHRPRRLPAVRRRRPPDPRQRPGHHLRRRPGPRVVHHRDRDGAVRCPQRHGGAGGGRQTRFTNNLVATAWRSVFWIPTGL